MELLRYWRREGRRFRLFFARTAGAVTPPTGAAGVEWLIHNDLSFAVQRVAHGLDDRAAVLTGESGLQRPARTPRLRPD